MQENEGNDILTSILLDISSVDDKNFQKNIDYYADRFISYYTHGGYNLYSPSYKWLNLIEQEHTEYISNRLDLIENVIERNSSKKNLEKFVKFKDYVDLEISRKTNTEEVKNITTQARKTLYEIKSLKDEIISKQKDNLSQTITILSIFTGIAMAFFGGFSMLSSSFSVINGDMNILMQVLTVSLVVGIVLFNTIFSFVYFAAKISGKDIVSNGHKNCEECRKGKKCENGLGLFIPLKKGFHKYPYVVYINILLITMFIFPFAYLIITNLSRQ